MSNLKRSIQCTGPERLSAIAEYRQREATAGLSRRSVNSTSQKEKSMRQSDYRMRA
jgi:hypothetical protein